MIKKEVKGIGQDVLYDVLPNGLRVFLIPFKNEKVKDCSIYRTCQSHFPRQYVCNSADSLFTGYSNCYDPCRSNGRQSAGKSAKQTKWNQPDGWGIHLIRQCNDQNTHQRTNGNKTGTYSGNQCRNEKQYYR